MTPRGTLGLVQCLAIFYSFFESFFIYFIVFLCWNGITESQGNIMGVMLAGTHSATGGGSMSNLGGNMFLRRKNLQTIDCYSIIISTVYLRVSYNFK